MIPLVKGITLNPECRGLLCLHADMLSSLMRSGKITDYYHVEQTPFARGKFAAVRKCTHKVTGVEYAAKFMRKRRRSMDQRNDIYHEVAVLKLAEDCTNIVNIHEVYETPAEIALILQLVAGGELQRVIDVYDGLEEQQAIRVLKQILEGLNFLHSYNIAHLDLKPQNLLITSSFPNCDIKLCDFGISRIIEKGIELREILGTPDYVAPEVLNYEPISLATDVWSIGVLTYVLLSGYSPFAGDTKQETFCNIAQCALSFPDELFHKVSDYAKDFIVATLVQDVNQRLTVDECLRHPWLNNSPICKTLLSPCVQVEDDMVSKSIVVLNGCNGNSREEHDNADNKEEERDEDKESSKDEIDIIIRTADSEKSSSSSSSQFCSLNNGLGDIDEKFDKKQVSRINDNKIDINSDNDIYNDCRSPCVINHQENVVHFSKNRSTCDEDDNKTDNNDNSISNNNNNNNNISSSSSSTSNSSTSNSSSDKKSNGVSRSTVEIILLDRSITC